MRLKVSENELQELNLEEELGFDPLDLENDLGLDLLNLEEQLELDPSSLQDPSPPSLSPKKDAVCGARAGTSSALRPHGSPAIKSVSGSGRKPSESISWSTGRDSLPAATTIAPLTPTLPQS